jgi:Ca-activated chloride channel homolog
MNFVYPLLLAFPLFFLFIDLVRYLSSRRREKGVEIAVFKFLKPPPPSFLTRFKKYLNYFLKWLAIIALSIAAAKPIKKLEFIPEQERINLMLCLDVSLSMETRDFTYGNALISRLEAVQLVVSDFINSRQNDRLGLTVFGKSAFLQSPLTIDHSLLQEMLADLSPGIAGNATAVGDGLGLAIKRIKDLPARSKAIILLTDGANNAGSISPIEAAKLASQYKIKVHTIGAGSLRAGDYDEASLKKIAKITGGVFFNAETTDKLKEVYEQIDRLEKIKSSEKKIVTTQDQFWPFAIIGTLALVVVLILNNFVFPVLPWG